MAGAGRQLESSGQGAALFAGCVMTLAHMLEVYYHRSKITEQEIFSSEPVLKSAFQL